VVGAPPFGVGFGLIMGAPPMGGSSSGGVCFASCDVPAFGGDLIASGCEVTTISNLSPIGSGAGWEANSGSGGGGFLD